jgi:predicted nicotinamide N-methyase
MSSGAGIGERDAGRRLRPSREIAGFPAELATVLIEPAAPGTLAHRLPLYRVADLERLVDRNRLLRDPHAPEPPYWATLWIGARAIAARLCEMPLAEATHVLDLGCGLGLSGVAAGIHGAHVVFADKVEAAVAFASANAELNALPSFETLTVDFTSDRLGRRFDVVLAADIVYNPADYGALVAFIDAHLRPGGLLMLTESLRADARDCVHALVALGYDNRTETTWILEDGHHERTWLHTMTKPRTAE